LKGSKMTGEIVVKDHVTAGNCTFVRARKGELWYRTALNFEFPVPFEDMGDATFEAEIKGILMMRYIRKQAEAVKASKAEAELA
jgi:hypothetical protein